MIVLIETLVVQDSVPNFSSTALQNGPDALMATATIIVNVCYRNNDTMLGETNWVPKYMSCLVVGTSAVSSLFRLFERNALASVSGLRSQLGISR